MAQAHLDGGELGHQLALALDLGPHSHGELHLVCAKSALDISRVRRVAELLQEELQRASL